MAWKRPVMFRALRSRKVGFPESNKLDGFAFGFPIQAQKEHQAHGHGPHAPCTPCLGPAGGKLLRGAWPMGGPPERRAQRGRPAEGAAPGLSEGAESLEGGANTAERERRRVVFWAVFARTPRGAGRVEAGPCVKARRVDTCDARMAAQKLEFRESSERGCFVLVRLEGTWGHTIFPTRTKQHRIFACPYGAASVDGGL